MVIPLKIGVLLLRKRCMWCDNPNHLRRECEDFQEALRRNIVYFVGNRVQSTKIKRSLELNQGRGGMKKLTEKAKARHVEAAHYLTSVSVRF